MSAVTFSTPELHAGETLFSSSSAYYLLKFIGEGCFGKVAKCVNVVTKEKVAVKILKKDPVVNLVAEKEVSVLELISVLNPDQTNLVKFFERFEYMGRMCLVFEMLNTNLFELLRDLGWRPLPLRAIRPIAEQLLVALDALKGLGILHTDLKLDNVMVVNKHDQQIRIKLIDFGAAITADKVKVGLKVQPNGYRAPEIILGLPFTEAIDVWGLGCVLACLYLVQNLFSIDCDYQMMKSIVEIIGQPGEHLLRAGIHTRLFFTEEKEESADAPSWRLLTPEEFTAVNKIKVQEKHSGSGLPSSLDALVHIYPEEGAAELQERLQFVDLMKRLLHLNGDERICPRQALQHPFISRSHLSRHPDSTHLEMMGTKQNRSEQDSDSGSSAPSTLQLLFLEEDQDQGLSDGEEPQISCKDPEASDEGLCSQSSTRSPDEGLCSQSSTRSPDEGLSSLSSTRSPDEGLCSQSSTRSPDEGLSSLSSTRSPDEGLCSQSSTRSPDEGLCSQSSTRSPDEGLCSQSSTRSPDEGLCSQSSTRSPDEGLCSQSSTQTPDEGLCPQSSTQSPDEGLCSLSSTQTPDEGLCSQSSTQSPDEGLCSLSSTQTPDEGLCSQSSTQSPDEGLCSQSSTRSSGSSDDADSASLSSDCVRGSFEEAPLPGSLRAGDSTASPSSGRSRKVLKRIGRFFRRIAASFCCCCQTKE